MKNFNLVSKFPEVIGAALTDTSGILLESSGRMDGEMAGAVHAFTARALAQAGDVLGLNSLERAVLSAEKSVCIIAVGDNCVLGVDVDPNKPIAAVEKKVWDAISK